MKKLLHATGITATIALLSACTTTVDVNIEDDSTGTFIYSQSIPMDILGGGMSMTEEDVEKMFDTESMYGEDLPGGLTFDTEVVNNDIVMTVSQDFEYNEEGVIIPGADEALGSAPAFNVIRDGNEVTVTVGGESGLDDSLFGGMGMGSETGLTDDYSSDEYLDDYDTGMGDMDIPADDFGLLASFMSVEVGFTFPGEVKEASEGAVIDGNSVSWDISPMDLTGGETISATGSLGGDNNWGVIAAIIFGGAIIALIGYGIGRAMNGRDENENTSVNPEGNMTHEPQEPVTFLPEDNADGDADDVDHADIIDEPVIEEEVEEPTEVDNSEEKR